VVEKMVLDQPTKKDVGLKETHSVLVKILESAPIVMNKAKQNCDNSNNNSKQEKEKEYPKIELCPWKKTKVVVEDGANVEISQCECDNSADEDEDEEEEVEEDYVELGKSKKRKCSMTDWRHNSTDSSESSSASSCSSGRSPNSYTDYGSDESDHSVTELCQQFNSDDVKAHIT
jgi:hypothetical protein